MTAFGLAVSVCLFTTFCHLASLLLAYRSLRPAVRRREPNETPGVTVVRPVCGMEAFADATLSSTFHLDYPRYEIIFCAAHAGDPIVPLVRRLIVEHPRVSAQLLIGNERINDNPKLNNIAKGWRSAKHDWIVVVDSNVLIRSDFIQRLLERWDRRTGLVSAPPLGTDAENFFSELECAFLNTYQARWQYCADAIGLAFAQGKCLMWRRALLEHAGGIAALGSELAEDAAFTKIVRSAGLRVRLSRTPARQPLGARSAAEVWHRQLRWIRLRRDTFPLFFVPEILTGGLPTLLALGTAMMVAEWPIVPALIGFLLLWYGAEFLFAWMLGWPLRLRSIPAAMLRDLLLPALWIAAWLGNGFVWRGHTMSVAGRPEPA